jgi:hypothetical protein
MLESTSSGSPDQARPLENVLRSSFGSVHAFPAGWRSGARIISLKAGACESISEFAELPYWVKAAIVIFVVYVCGLVCQIFVNLSTFYFVRCGLWIFKRLSHHGAAWLSRPWPAWLSQTEPWKDPVWRTMATHYIGAFAPTLRDSLGKPLLTEAQASTEELDKKWKQWFDILEEYFLDRLAPVEATMQGYFYFLAMVNSVGWSAILLLALSYNSHALLWSIAVLCVLTGVYGEFISSIKQQSNLAVKQIAQILKNHESPSALSIL